MTGKFPVAPPLLLLLGVGVLVLLVLVAVGKVPLRYNARNLVVRWITTLLTALVFTIVIGLLVFMLAFVNGMAKLTENSGQPGNVMVLSDGATDEAMSNLAYNDVGDVERQAGVLTDAEGRPLCSKEVFLVVLREQETAPGAPKRRRFMQVRGVEDPVVAGEVHSLPLYPGGQWFSEAGVQAITLGGEKVQAIEAVLGEGVARDLGKDVKKERLDTGDTFEMGSRTWLVVGVMQSAGSTFGSEIWAKRTVVGPQFGKETLTALVLRTRDAKAAEELAEDLNKNYKKASLAAQPETEYYSKLSATNIQFLGAIIFLTIFLALGGIAGVMNTMFAAISQRTKDIGVLRILGFKRWQILLSFFLESITIALIGGLIGCAAGFLLADGLTATSIVSSGQGGGKSIVLQLNVTPNTLAVGIVLTLFMGGFGGLIPALVAMRLKPLESVR